MIFLTSETPSTRFVQTSSSGVWVLRQDWIGNEAGWAGETNWLTDERGYAPESNGMYGTEDGWQWDPGESDAKFTDKGWFWHEGEKPLSVERLFQMYLETVGRNATLILNCPPDKRWSVARDRRSRAQGYGQHDS